MKRLLGNNNPAMASLSCRALLVSFFGVFLFSLSSVSAQVPPPPNPIKLGTPQNLLASSVSPSQINLSWGAIFSPGLSGYRIYRCSGSGCTPTAQVGTTNSTTTVYSDTGLASGTYVYAVTAYSSNSGFIESDKSSSVQVNTQVRTYSLSDFVTLVSQWLQSGTGLASDVNTDNVVNTRDLGIMMSFWTGV
ncbi:MAG: fibronectin type III domain-containing protein [Candidatus Moraniibacteriota bacterium]